MDGSTPNYTAHSRAMEFWDHVVADMEATAAEYEEAGWDTLLLHPGDVTPIPSSGGGSPSQVVDVGAGENGADESEVGENGAAEEETSDADPDEREFGLDVLVPDNEFEDLEALLDSGVSFDSFEAYRAAEDQLVFLVVAMEDRDTETAVCYPAYYDVRGAREMLDRAEQAGQMYTFVRVLSEDRIRFTHEDTEMFQPPEPDESDQVDDAAEEADTDGSDEQ